MLISIALTASFALLATFVDVAVEEFVFANLLFDESKVDAVPTSTVEPTSEPTKESADSQVNLSVMNCVREESSISGNQDVTTDRLTNMSTSIFEEPKDLYFLLNFIFVDWEEPLEEMIETP